MTNGVRSCHWGDQGFLWNSWFSLQSKRLFGVPYKKRQVERTSSSIKFPWGKHCKHHIEFHRFPTWDPVLLNPLPLLDPKPRGMGLEQCPICECHTAYLTFSAPAACYKTWLQLGCFFFFLFLLVFFAKPDLELQVLRLVHFLPLPLQKEGFVLFPHAPRAFLFLSLRPRRPLGGHHKVHGRREADAGAQTFAPQRRHLEARKNWSGPRVFASFRAIPATMCSLVWVPIFLFV